MPWRRFALFEYSLVVMFLSFVEYSFLLHLKLRSFLLMDSATKDGRDSNRTVYITDVPADVDEEDLELYLTNKRLGGGEIDDLQLDASNRTALVKFAASEG